MTHNYIYKDEYKTIKNIQQIQCKMNLKIIYVMSSHPKKMKNQSIKQFKIG